MAPIRGPKGGPPLSTLLEKMEDAWDQRSCLHPKAGPAECSKGIIRSHSIARAQSLESISNKGQVLTFFSKKCAPTKRTSGDREARINPGSPQNESRRLFQTRRIETDEDRKSRLDKAGTTLFATLDQDRRDPVAGVVAPFEVGKDLTDNPRNP